MANALRKGGVYQVGEDRFVDAKGRGVAPPTQSEVAERDRARTGKKQSKPARPQLVKDEPAETEDTAETVSTDTTEADARKAPESAGKDVIGEDYPGARELAAHSPSITSRAAVRALTDKELAAVDGIGPAKLKAIRELDPHEAAE